MLLGFKTELHPNNQQKTLLAKHALCSLLAQSFPIGMLPQTLTPCL
ncbi:helix-turn-helix domain-containing protein [Okeania sp. KiyG1]|nr:helix-turn-helix domain-containing protein [Okeania sp. KiyG1]